MKKERVLEAVNELPQDFDLEEFMEKLILVEKVEKGLEQLAGGQVKSHEEVKELVKKW